MERERDFFFQCPYTSPLVHQRDGLHRCRDLVHFTKENSNTGTHPAVSNYTVCEKVALYHFAGSVDTFLVNMVLWQQLFVDKSLLMFKKKLEEDGTLDHRMM